MALFLTTINNNSIKPGLVPLADKLDEKNFSTWKYQAWLTIQTLELEKHLDPSQTPSPTITVTVEDSGDSAQQSGAIEGNAAIPQPKPKSATVVQESAEYQQWRQNDLALQTWLAASITKTYQNKILNCKSFYEAWSVIQQIVSASSKTRIQSLKSQLRGIKKTGGVDEYLKKIRNISESLAALDYQLSDDDYVQAIIEGLNEDYNGFKASVMTRFGSFSVAEAESFLQAYDEMITRNSQTNQPIAVANLTQSYYPPIRGGGRRGRGGGRFQRGGRKSWQNTRTYCQICGRGGHAATNCYYRFDQQYTQFQGSQNSAQQIPYANATPPPPSSNFHQPKAFVTAPPPMADSSWYPDSGASHHVTPDPANFISAGTPSNSNDQLLVGYTQPPSPWHI